MTNGEAIEILRKNRPTSDPRPCGMELCDAVDMAISALRQQDVTGKDVGKNEPLTNAQKIRAMSDEELAEVLSAPCLGCVVKNCRLHNYGSGGCTIAFLKWLQQPAEEDDHA